MKLPSILVLVVGIVVAHWLHKRLERVEIVSGSWRVQPPWSNPEWYASDEFDQALAEWSRHHRDEDVA